MPAAAATAHYTNRELSWLQFNQRVLMEATDPANPLLERAKFLAIVSSNLDEFFMVRIASLKDQVKAGFKKADPAGLKPREQLKLLEEAIRRQVKQQYKIFTTQLIPELHTQGIHLLAPSQLTRDQSAYLEDYFTREIFPALTPLAADATRRFPLLLSRSLNLGIFLQEKSGRRNDFATLRLPSTLPRMVQLPASEGETPFMLLEDVVALYADHLFPGHQVVLCQPYRITRNADLSFCEDDASDLLQEIKKSLGKRKWGAVVRLELPKGASPDLLELLKHALEITDDAVYPIDGPINLDFLMKQLAHLPKMAHLLFPPFTPKLDSALAQGSIFDRIRERDWFFYHPYDSFQPIVDFVSQAAKDPQVLAIKQTLYRVSGHSPIVAALAQAAENGKQVTVLLEVKARFDEENNIHWGEALERAGCHVIYGLKGLKTHSKITLVVRREAEGIRRYVHLGTGNYNDVTARLYTDMGLLTANPTLGEDAGHFFNMVTGYAQIPDLKLLVSAPMQLRGELSRLILREREHALAGRPSGITAKMNSLVDPQIISLLYRASQAGVPIDLTVRGICCLQPGIKGLSETITVRSIVGRFLEHARIFRFHNGGTPETYLSSADWMPRNLDRRVELMFPITDPAIVRRIMAVVEGQQRDNQKAWYLDAQGSYTKRCIQGEEAPWNCQESLLRDAAP